MAMGTKIKVNLKDVEYFDSYDEWFHAQVRKVIVEHLELEESKKQNQFNFGKLIKPFI